MATSKCHLDQPCHAHILLTLATTPENAHA